MGDLLGRLNRLVALDPDSGTSSGGGGEGSGSGQGGGNGQEGGNQQGGGREAGGSGDGDGLESLDANALKEALRKERQLRRQIEKEAKPLRQRIEEIENAGKTELQKAQDRIKALEGQLGEVAAERRQARLERAVRQSNRKLNLALVDDDAAVRLLDVEYDDDGNPLDVEGKLKALVKERPYLVGNRRMGSGDAGNGGGGNGAASDMNALLRRAAGRG